MDKQFSKNKTGVRFVTVTLAIKLIFLLVLVLGIPYYVVTVLGRYDSRASGIVEQQADLVSAYSGQGMGASTSGRINQIKVLSPEEALKIAKISDFIGGDWFSDQDGRYRLSIDPNYKFSEYYDGSKEGYGVWKISSSMSLRTIRAIAQNPNASVKPEYDYFFQKEQFEPDHKGEIYKYRIDQLDDDTFIMTYVDGPGNPLVFRKSTSTIPVIAR